MNAYHALLIAKIEKSFEDKTNKEHLMISSRVDFIASYWHPVIRFWDGTGIGSKKIQISIFYLFSLYICKQLNFSKIV